MKKQLKRDLPLVLVRRRLAVQHDQRVPIFTYTTIVVDDIHDADDLADQAWTRLCTSQPKHYMELV